MLNMLAHLDRLPSPSGKELFVFAFFLLSIALLLMMARDVPREENEAEEKNR